MNRDSTVVLQNANILTYIGGYISRKIRGSICDSYRQKILAKLDPSNKDHTFLSHKSYSQAKEGFDCSERGFLRCSQKFGRKICED